jgi:hypothetical protein
MRFSVALGLFSMILAANVASAQSQSQSYWATKDFSGYEDGFKTVCEKVCGKVPYENETQAKARHERLAQKDYTLNAGFKAGTEDANGQAKDGQLCNKKLWSPN